MTKRLSLLLGLWLVLAFPIGVSAQGIVPGSSPSEWSPFGGAGFSEWVSTITSLPGLNRSQAGDLLIKPTVRLGYKKIGFNFNLDIPPTQLLSPFGLVFPQFGTLLDRYPLDVKIQSADLAVGTFRLDAQIGQACGLFGGVSASIPRTVGIRARQGPDIGMLPPEEWRWTGSRFQWSEFELGGWYRICKAANLVGGIRFDRISVRFSDPEPLPGYAFFTIFPLPLPKCYLSGLFGRLQYLFHDPVCGLRNLGPIFQGVAARRKRGRSVENTAGA